ncbi:aspartate carbamoyltransferase catalytic subunit [Frigidibacter sp. ROC022]|uniref:aspartate carbamoyltransferase catalytic subunit n=1 Tax=Frigidibacter sp. ROC022 TaxID=2971796 RepID=UPI00215A17A1|nr:aspartate carbamoyltransferase catalytic subunit [Frigidibacter sp. ROC022]MCR8726606.1 aspartate carbamoyltransferase catalytic subunit [Frigidibacter sp. ROC022]
MTDDRGGWDDILDPGERILWQGRPRGGVIWTDLLSVQSVFGLFFAGFAVFWVLGAASITGGFHRMSGPDVFRFFPLFGLPFVAVGLYMVVGRLFWDAYLRGRTWYTLSDRTAYIATDTLRGRKLERYPIEPDTRLILNDGEIGNLWFAERVVHRAGGYTGTGSSRRYRGPRTTVHPVGFRRIESPRRVFALMRDAQAAMNGAAAVRA